MEDKVSIVQLKKITNYIFDSIIQDLKINTVQLNDDMYWSIDEDELYEINKEPSNFGIGQLYDDLFFLRKIVTEPKNTTSLMFMHLAPILIYLAKKIDWYSKELVDKTEV
ncbi:hypothetical protein [Thiolinea disciformis]|uniref:hypothetical protein n=1 Tax=Thiolinea disciformis TaxID=125614 RepID=UPI00036FACBD|nr:hypothetical protein [Thiolinea disciformis]